MDRKNIGLAFKNVEELTTNDGVTIKVPFGEDNYALSYTNRELDALFLQGIQRRLTSVSDGRHEFITALELHDSFFVVEAEEVLVERFRVEMKLGLLAVSFVHDFQAIAHLRGSNIVGWNLQDLSLQHLSDPEHVGMQN